MAEPPPRADQGRRYFCQTCEGYRAVYHDLGGVTPSSRTAVDVVCLTCGTILICFEREE